MPSTTNFNFNICCPCPLYSTADQRRLAPAAAAGTMMTATALDSATGLQAWTRSYGAPGGDDAAFGSAAIGGRMLVAGATSGALLGGNQGGTDVVVLEVSCGRSAL
jgi:hypothetical protein